MKGTRLLFLSGFVALLAFDTLGQISFKLAAEQTSPVEPTLDFFGRLTEEPWVLAVLVAYGGAFLTYMTLMKKAPIGPLFAASHLEIVSVAVISVYLFGERLSAIQILGSATILVGVLILALAERDKEQA